MRFSVIAWLDNWSERKINDFMAGVESHEQAMDEMVPDL